MGSKINIELDLFCARCLTALTIEDSAGHHILIEPCKCASTLKRKEEDEIRDEVREETIEPQKVKMSGEEKKKEWEKAKKEQEKLLLNVRKMERGEV